MTSHTSLNMTEQPRNEHASNTAPASKVEEAIAHFNSLLELPVVTRATFLPGVQGDSKNALQLDTSHRSLSALTKRTATQTLGLSKDGSVAFQSPLSFSAPEVQHTSYSPDGRLQALFRSTPAKEGKESKKVVEIWSLKDGVRLHELDVSKDHGDWYFDATFGSVSWHPTGHSLVYTAEAPKPKPDPKSKLPRSSDFQYARRSDFGETFTGKCNPCIFLFVLPDSPFASAVSSAESASEPTCHRLTNGDEYSTIDFGQAVFLPDSPSASPRILATGYHRLGDDRKLGIVYCANRPARIYELELSVVPSTSSDESTSEGSSDSSSLSWRALSATPQSDTHRSARSARVLHPPPGAQFAPLVVFLSNPVGGPHSSCSSLHAVSLQPNGSAKTVELVPSVDKPASLADFPGLYLDQLPQQCFVVMSMAGPAVVLTSTWRSRRVPLLVYLRTGKVERLADWPEGKETDLPYLGNEVALESFNVLGTDGAGKIVATRSGPGSPPKVVVADLSKREVHWQVVKTPSLSQKLSSALDKISFTVLPLPKFGASEIILVSQAQIDSASLKANARPLITFPHGGPHSTTTTDFNASVAAYALAGYSIAMNNYPGSLGMGQSFVDMLPPSLGTLEVEATHAVHDHLVALGLAQDGKGKRLVMGGSHGGWITAHLTSKYPGVYDAAVMRNPVVDLPSMLYATDIPDWTYAECTLPYSLTRPPITLDPKTFERLHSVSPLAKVDQVRTPTLLHIGDGDRRVPPDQGRTWYHALKGIGKEQVETDMLWFPGNGHGLDSTVECEITGFESGVRWLERWTKW